MGALPFTSIRPGLRREEGTEQPVSLSGKTSLAFVDESWDLLYLLHGIPLPVHRVVMVNTSVGGFMSAFV